MTLHKWHLKPRWLLVLMVSILPLTLFSLRSNYVQAQTDSRLFPETGKRVRGSFLGYWNAHGGLSQQGYPISDEMQEKNDTDGKTYTVQYFERAVFEMHPENKPPYDVLLSLLGNFRYKQKYPGGAPSQQPNTSQGSHLFPETGKRLGGRFLEYWKANGGLAQQGFPISDEFMEKSELDGKTYRVQYFQRTVFELHTENKPPYDVLLTQLGTFRYRAKYTAQQPSSELALQSDFLRSEGVLYVQDKYYQAEGVSTWEASSPPGGLTKPITTTYEWWIDAQNPHRFRRATIELLEDGPKLVAADGSDGVTAWWELDVSKRITQPTRHEGLYPFGATREGQTEMTFDRWLGIFTRTGQRLTDELRRGEVQQVSQAEESPWGKVISIRRTDSRSGHITTFKVRAEAPHVLIERVQLDAQGKLIGSNDIMRWGWLNPKSVDGNFWMIPPTPDTSDLR